MLLAQGACTLIIHRVATIQNVHAQVFTECIHVVGAPFMRLALAIAWILYSSLKV